MRAYWLGLALLLVAGLVHSDDINVSYEPRKQYRYQYDGTVVSKSRLTRDEESRMSIKANVIITAITQDDLKMQVMNLVMDDVPTHDSQLFREAVEKYDLRFSYENGMVRYLVPHDEEEAAATNFKRGILSAIQSKMTDINKPETIVYEADVLGECETEYHITQPSDILVKKTKHNCRYNNYLPYIPSERYSNRKLSGDPPLKLNKQSCQMHLQDRVWSRVECFEELEIMEFKNIFSGKSSSPYPILASVRITTNLVLEAGPEDAPEPLYQYGFRKRRESLRMDLEGAIESADRLKHQDSNVQEEISIVMNYLTSSGKGSGFIEKRPHAFTHLVNLIGQLERVVEIDEVWGTYAFQQETRQYLLDALILCESRTCVALLSRLGHESPEAFPKTRVLTWLSGLHFHTKPHPDSVQYLMELARNNEDIEQQAVMAASSVVHSLCQRKPSSCRSDAQPLLEYVQEKVGESCGDGQTKEGRQQVKNALRVISNAGVLPNKQFPRKCYMNKLLTPEIRIAALQSFRRVTCNEMDLDNPWQILEDVNDDVGVRIAAYLSMVRCAVQRPKFFTRVKNFLEKEEVNQVGSYIWTHVRNLADNPDDNTLRREISLLANHHNLRAKFITNAFRTSRNYRVAQFSKLMNIGGSIDSDLIFTPESYIPRYESHKFHFDFLDNSIDAFEIGGDFKGLEGYIERLFGKDGYFENEEIQKVLETFRPKRDIKDEKIQEMQAMYDESRTMNEIDQAESSPEAGFYLRVFGNEVFYVNDIINSNPLQLLNDFMQEFAVPRSFQILKQEFVSPTILGFPMRFRVNATGSITAENRKDFRMDSITDFSLEGQVSASFVTSMDKTIMIDGYGSSSGIRIRSTHNINTDFGGKIVVQDAKVVDIELRVPNDEFVHVSTTGKVSLYENDRQDWIEKDYEASSGRSEFCLDDYFSRFTGMRFCSSSNRYAPVIDSWLGDVYNSEFTLGKSDTFDLYKLSFQSQVGGFKFMFDTPGSSTDRKLELQAGIEANVIQSTLTIPGNTYSMEGSYSKTDELTNIDFRYNKDSVTLAEVELSIPLSFEASGKTYKPKFIINLKDYFEMDLHSTLHIGQDIFSFEGNMKNSLMENPVLVKASWDHASSQHKIEGNLKAGSLFVSTSGTLLLSGDKTLVQMECEYGTDALQPNTLILTFDKTLTYEKNDPQRTGYLLLKSNVGLPNLELEYIYSAHHMRIETNVTVAGKEVTSQITVKNEALENFKDFEVALKFACPQLGVNYVSQLIYKTSDNAFQSQLEVILGSYLNTKVALGYTFDQNPLHLRGSVHFHLNNFIIQFAHKIDLSQPGKFILMSSNTLDVAGATLQAKFLYDKKAPFNAIFDFHAMYNDKLFGIEMDSSSNNEWSNFQGQVQVTWFDWNYSFQHQLTLEENNKKLSISCDSGHLELMLQNDREFTFEFSVQRSQSKAPDLKFVALKQIEAGSTSYETYLQSSAVDLIHFTFVDNGDNSFSGRAKFLSSQIEANGNFLQNERGSTQVHAQSTLTFPSGETVDTRFDIIHTYDGETREIQVSSRYQEEVIEGNFQITSKDGWFNRDHRRVAFTFASPFQGLRKIGMALETHSDWSNPWFAEIEWQEVKIHGECKLGDINNLEIKVLYEDGGSCDSILHLYHRPEGKRYLSGAIIGITKAFDPWSIEVITTERNDTVEGKIIDINLIFQCPLQQNSFEAKVNYKVLDSNFSLEFGYGSDEKTKLVIFGENETIGNHHKLFGVLNFESPWSDPVIFTIENLQDSKSLNVSLDLQTSWVYGHTVRAELSATFNSPEETFAHLYITHQNLQITMEMIHELKSKSLKQVIKGNVNSVILNYNLNVNWEEDFAPVESFGNLNISGLLDHNIEMGFTQRIQEKQIIIQLTGGFDQHKFIATHELIYEHLQGWSSTLKISLSDDKSVKLQLLLDSKKVLSIFESTCHFSSSWTEDFDGKLKVHGSKQVEYIVEAKYGDNTIISRFSHMKEAYFLMEVSSSFFDDFKFVWQHEYDPDKLIVCELLLGEKLQFKTKIHLNYQQGFFRKKFKGFEFALIIESSEPQLQFKIDASIGNSFSGEFLFRRYEYLLRLNSSIPDNTVFVGSLSYPGNNFHTGLFYEIGGGNIPDFTFKFTRNDEDLLTFNGKFLSTYPEFSSVYTFYYFDQSTLTPKNGKLEMQGDLSRLKDFAFKGTMKLDSDFEGFESYWADLEIAFEIEKVLSGYLRGQLHVGDWHYDTKVGCKIMKTYRPRTHAIEYHSSYVLKYGDQLYDKKELNLEISVKRRYLGHLKLSLAPKVDSPSYSIFFKFDEELNAYIIPGNENKYEITLNPLEDNVLGISAQQEDIQGDTFNYFAGNITWNMESNKKQFSINFKSDLTFMNTVQGDFILRQERDVAVNFKLNVNDKNFTGLLKFIAKGRNAGKITFNLQNEIYIPFNTNSTIEYAITMDGVEVDLNIDSNEKKNWGEASLKGSLTESYLRFKLPFEHLNDFDLSVSIETEDKYGLNVEVTGSLFCFTFNFSLNRDFFAASLFSRFDWKCSGNPIYEFTINYSREGYRNFNAETHLQVQNFGTLFRLKISRDRSDGKRGFQIMTEIYPSFYHTFDVNFSFNRHFSVQIELKKTHSDETEAGFKFFVDKTQIELEIEVLDLKVIYLKVRHNFGQSSAQLDISYSHSVFGYSFNSKFTMNANFSPQSGNAEFRLATDGSFDHANFTLNYNITQNFQGHLILDTSIGNTEIKATVEQTGVSKLLKADMYSSLHSFKKYRVEALYEFPGRNRKLHVKTIQDDIEFELDYSKTFGNELVNLNVDLRMPFKKVNSLKINYIYPDGETFNHTFSQEARLSFITFSEQYELYGKFLDSRNKQEIECSISTPPRVFGKYGISLKYDLNGQISFHFINPRGLFRLSGSWNIADYNFAMEANADLSIFSKGEYRLKMNVPLKLHQGIELEFISLNTNSGFNFHLHIDGANKNGTMVLTARPSDEVIRYFMTNKSENRIYSEGQMYEWTVEVKVDLTGKQFLVAAGTFDIISDDLRIATGSWDVMFTERSYYAVIDINISEKGTIRFEADLSPQLEEAVRPWEAVKLEINFTSPFTKTHKFTADCDISEFRMTSTYQLGSETFNVDLYANISDIKGSISANGNIPMKYLSTFGITLDFNFRRSVDINLKMYVEETFLEIISKTAFSGRNSHSSIFWSSPYTTPLVVTLKWSFDPLMLEILWKYGNQEVNIAANLEYSDVLAVFHFRSINPFKIANFIQLDVNWDFSDSSNILFGTDLRFDKNMLKINSIMNDGGGGNFNANVKGQIEMRNFSGNINLALRILEMGYEIEIAGQTKNSELLNTIIHFNTEDMHCTLKYGEVDVMLMRLNFDTTEVKFVWHDMYVNMKSYHKMVDRSFDMNYSLESSETDPLSINASFIARDKYNGNVNVRYGEKDYVINGTLSLQSRTSSLEFYFVSSDSYYKPLILSVKYDLSDFLAGIMKSEEDLVVLSFEWGDKLQLLLRGQNLESITKVTLDITMPFREFPEIHIGYEGQLMKAGLDIDLNFNAYFEWSEKVVFDGLLNLKNKMLNININISTPFPGHENFSISIKKRHNHLETSGKLKDEEWKATFYYQVSPDLFLSVVAQTPVDGFKDFSLNSSAIMNGNKFTAIVSFIREGKKDFDVKLTAEMWQLNINLLTPWEPLNKASFVTFLRTESEELMYHASAEWNSSAADIRLMFSPVHLKFTGNYKVDGIDIGFVTLEYGAENDTVVFSSDILTPFDVLKAFEFSFQLSFAESKFTSSLYPYYDITIEAKNQLREIDLKGSVKNPYGGDPYKFIMKYHINPRNAVSAAFEVVSDVTWISFDIDTIQEWYAQVHIYDDMISIRAENREEFIANITIKPQNFYLESINLVTTFMHSDSKHSGSMTLTYKFQQENPIQHELIWHSTMQESIISIIFNLKSDNLRKPFDIEIDLPLINILKNVGKFRIRISEDRENEYIFSYEKIYPLTESFTHIIKVMTPRFTAEFSQSFTKINFELSFFYPNEESKHSVVVSWVRDISLDKFALHVELNSPFWNVTIDLVTKQWFCCTLNSSISYGTRKVDINGELQYNSEQQTITFDASVTSDWIGNHSAKINVGWLGNSSGTYAIKTTIEEQTVKLQVNRKDFNAELIATSLWLSSKEVQINGDVTVDVDTNSGKILIKTNLEVKANEKDYSLLIEFSENTENLRFNLKMRSDTEEILKIYRYYYISKHNSLYSTLEISSDVIDLLKRIYVTYSENGERKELKLYYYNQYTEYKNRFDLLLSSHKQWQNEQKIELQFFNVGSFGISVKLGDEKGEIGFKLSSDNFNFKSEIDYNFSEGFEFEINLRTPYNSIELFNLEFEWSIRKTNQVTLYYQWYNDKIISFELKFSPDSITGWILTAHLITPFDGFEKFSLQTSQLATHKVPTFMIEYPEGKIGLDLRNFCSRWHRCIISYVLYLPFERYEVVSVQFDSRSPEIGVELRVGKVGFTLKVGLKEESNYYQLGALVRVNEYRSEGYFRIYNSRDRYRGKFHLDFEMQDLLQLKVFDVEFRYDPKERIMFEVKTDQEELLKLLMAWGTDKIVAIKTPKRYPGYLVLNLELSGSLDDYQIEAGISKRGEQISWEKYGFHIQQKQLGYGRDLLVAGMAGQHQFAVEGSVTINPMYKDNFYLKQGISVEINQKKIGIMTDFHTDFGFLEDRYCSDMQLILPEQILHSYTNVSFSSRSFGLLSQLKWNDYDHEDDPITLSIDYDEVSVDSNKYTLQAVFSHPEIQNLILQGNLSYEVTSVLVTAEFIDENDLLRNIQFEMSSVSDLEHGSNTITANLTQSFSNFALTFDAEIQESIFNKATYQLNYWSQSLQQWERMNLTTEIKAMSNGWKFSGDLYKLDSNWGHTYNGSLFHHDNAFTFNIMVTSALFMDYWKFESTINKLMPELDLQLHIGQLTKESREVGRVRAGLHNPFEFGLILDHERFGVWRQDARAGIQLKSRDLLQFVVEYDPSHDFTSRELISSLMSPAIEIAYAWEHNLIYAASVFQSWASSEIIEVFRIEFDQTCFQSILNYNTIKYQHFKDAVMSALSSLYKDFADPSHHFMAMYTSIQQFFESVISSFSDNWSHLVQFVDIQYKRLQYQLIADMGTLNTLLTEITYVIEGEFQYLMYQMMSEISVFFEIASMCFQELQRKLTPTFEHYQGAFERYGQELEAAIGGQCLTNLRQLMHDVKVSFDKMSYMVENFIQPQDYVRYMQGFKNWIVQWYTTNRGIFKAGLSQLQEAIRSLLLFENLMNDFRYYAEDFAAVIHQKLFRDNLFDLGALIMARTGGVLKVLREHSMGSFRFDYFDAITGNLVDRVVLVWEDWKTDEEQVLVSFQRFVVAVTNTLRKILTAEKLLIFEPEKRGELIYNQYLPVPWNSFLEAPQWHYLNVFQESPMIESQRKLNEGFDKINSAVEAFFMPGSALPPFTATATVYGQQITTFDLFHYQFLGSCSYLMTKDFVGGDFEVIGDYSRSGEGEIRLKSMIIRAQDTDVTLHVDGNQEVRNQGSAEVYTEGNFVAFKQGALFVTCNKISRGCSVTVGSKYFGRLAGLFGNYNYEPSDDFRGPSGRKAEEGNDMGNSWAVSSEPCYQGNQVKAINNLTDIRDYGICHDLFLKESSPFSRCFSNVDPRPYFWHCVRDQNRPDFGNEVYKSCDSAAAYRTQCASRGLHLLPISQCTEGAGIE